MSNKILELCQSLLPEDVREEVSSAIEAHLKEATEVLAEEYQTKLDEAYAEYTTKLAENDQVGEEGYQQAYEMICEYADRLERQRAEFNEHLETEYESAYALIEAEKAKNGELEDELRKVYESENAQDKTDLVEKVHAFLAEKGEEFYTQARREVESDPRVVEHKLAFDKILETAVEYLTDEDYVLATNSKLDSISQELENTRIQLNRLKNNNTKLTAENTKLTESYRHAQQVISESKATQDKTEKKERLNEARNVVGKGNVSNGTTKTVEVITEGGNGEAQAPVSKDTDMFSESSADSLLQLAGVKKRS